MPQATVLPISVNDLQTSMSVNSSAYTSALGHLQHGYFLARNLSGTVQDHESVY